MAQADREIAHLTELVSRLPGLGPRSATRVVTDLLTTHTDLAEELAQTLTRTIKNICHCRKCNTLSTVEICDLCADETRDPTIICVVEMPQDAIAIEESVSYRGQYFVLMGRINSAKGVGPIELAFDKLLDRASDPNVKEVVVATSFTAEGEATAHMLIAALKKHVPEVHVTRLSRGIPNGIEVEYTDASTLASAMVERRQG